MKTFSDDLDEASRLLVLRRFELLDTPREAAFDRVTAMTARRFNVPVAVISLVDEDRIWFKSTYGLDVRQIGRELGLCATTVLADAPRILADATLDALACNNPLVSGPFGLRFYAGAPLRTRDGYRLGTLSAIDRTPRQVDPALIDDLEMLAALVVDQMELRLAAGRALADADLMAQEIDHRVMNSLQFVSSLLTLQSRQVLAGADAARQLEIAAGRVAAVAKVHRHFYARKDGETLGSTFLDRLCADLSDVTGRQIAVETEPMPLKDAWLQPLALLVNELITNAAKHGGAHIGVALRPQGSGFELCVRDDGPGLPERFDPAKGSGLGMKVALGLSRQLGATLHWTSGEGGGSTCFTVTTRKETAPTT